MNSFYELNYVIYYNFEHFRIGVYCFLLTVIDAATNSRHARRFALFDNETTVQTSTRCDNRIVVVSAIENATHIWQTNLNSPVRQFGII